MLVLWVILWLVAIYMSVNWGVDAGRASGNAGMGVVVTIICLIASAVVINLTMKAVGAFMRWWKYSNYKREYGEPPSWMK